MKVIRLDVTTDASGDGTSPLVAVPGGGTLYAVQCVDGDFADGVDLVLTAEQSELSIPLLTVADFNSDRMYYPRVLQNLSTDGTALTTHCEPVVFGRVKAVVAQGGNTKTGAFILYIREQL